MTHIPAPPFAHTSGPLNAKIALVGEAWGQDEETAGGIPFIGWSGQELTRMLNEAGISRGDCFLTNVLALRPPNNNLELLCVSKKEAGGKDYRLPPLKKGKYLHPQYLPELERLRQELLAVQPNIIVALGATAAWALLGNGSIGAVRGATASAQAFFGQDSNWVWKTLPTYHPAAVLRNWPLRPIVLSDLIKALKHATFPELRRTSRQVLVWPTIFEVEAWTQSIGLKAASLAVDVETRAKQITCLGFGAGPTQSMTVPFWDERHSRSYWETLALELQARRACQALLDSPIPKTFQNGLYDLQYLLRESFRPRAMTDDTMLLHHSIYPEMQKGLGFLGSIYCDEGAWKLMRKDNAKEVKKDE